MTHSVSVPQLGSEFDDFLFAPIGDDKNGMLLSVLSALARLNIDPWQEAASLAQLPGEGALERLTSLIAALPGGPSARRDPGTIAARLIALLPRRVSAKGLARGALLGAGAAAGSQAFIRFIVINMIIMALMLSAQSIIAFPQPLAQTEGAPEAPPLASSAQMLLPSSSQ